ncbi:MAG: hypothetical protein HYV96_14490 [Opitutae bacterium]|nr:hypothetical protein [Opitutae bacterium]
MNRKLLILIVGFAVLLGALAVQFRHAATTTVTLRHEPLKTIFPSSIPGVLACHELELGPTETARAEVEKTLRYDDLLYCEYRLRAAVVTVYVAYWGPGRMPTQLVASHTPDRCWVSAGWTCEEMRHQVALGAARVVDAPGEWRRFAGPDGARLQVQFWQLVGGELYDYGERSNRVPSIWRWWRDAARQALRAPPEQYFIRVTSDRPFEQLAGDPGWLTLERALARIGLGTNTRAVAARVLTKDVVRQ